MLATPIYERNNRGNRMKYPHILGKLHSSKYLLVALTFLAIGVGFTGAHAYASRSVVKRSNCVDICVSILKDGFSQSELAVKVGSTVEFRSADGASHNLALGDGDSHSGNKSLEDEHEDEAGSEDHSHEHVNGTESGVFGADEAWRVQFKEPGTFIIHDHLNPETSILVVAYKSSEQR